MSMASRVAVCVPLMLSAFYCNVARSGIAADWCAMLLGF